MREVLVRCLLLNLIGIFASGVLLLFYPEQQGFTLTSGSATHYVQGRVFLSAALVISLDLIIAACLGYRMWHPR